MLRGLRTALYTAPDLARAKAFYTEVLGTPPYFDQPFYVGFDVGGYELGLVPDGRSSALWAVDDLEAAVARFRALGAAVLEAPHDVGDGIAVATVADPAGNPLGLIANPHFRAEVGARVAATGASMSRQVIEVETTVPLTPEQVWPLWTTETGLRGWFGNDCRMELRIGGPFEIYFLETPGSRGSEGCRILSFLEPRLLSFTWNAPPHLQTRFAHTWVVVAFDAVQGGTRVRLTHTGWPEAGMQEVSSDWTATFAYFSSAWGYVLRELAAHCGKLPD